MDSWKTAASKTMNTHLHILEAYTNLKRVWENEKLQGDLQDLVNVFCDHLFNPEMGHFKFLLDEAWNSKLDVISFGHEIEGSWLMYEAAAVLDEPSVLTRVREVTLKLAQTVYEEGLDRKSGGIFYEREKEKYRTNKIWWAQSEALVGFLNASELTGQEYFLEAAYGIWRFIQCYLVDRVNGEWFFEVSRKGKPKKRYPKVNVWKCPYHNARACMEVLRRMDEGKYL